MARKSRPLDSYTPAYRRRLERAAERNQSRQEARGHAAREHVTRAARARAAGRPTSAELERIKRNFVSINEQAASRRVPGVDVARAMAAIRQSPILKEEILAAMEARRRIMAETRVSGFAGFGPGADAEFAAAFAGNPWVRNYWFWYH